MQNFYFNSGPIEDKPDLILAEIEKCFAQLASAKGKFGYLRQPPEISREKCYESNRMIAWVVCRISISDDPQDFVEEGGAMARQS